MGGSYQINKDGINLDLIKIIGLYLKISGLLTHLQPWVDVWVSGWIVG